MKPLLEHLAIGRDDAVYSATTYCETFYSHDGRTFDLLGPDTGAVLLRITHWTDEDVAAEQRLS